MQQLSNKPKLSFSALLLSIVLAVMALRASYTESIQPSLNVFGGYENIVISLALSGVLLLCWCLFSIYLLRKDIETNIRPSFLFPLVLFFAVAIITIFQASSKRLAINYTSTLVVSSSMAILVYYLLREINLAKVILVVIFALAVMNVVEAFNQHNTSNDVLVEDYQGSPEKHLQRLGIQEDSLEHFQYEHRLYSKDIKGYFTTSNSVSSFYILALFPAIGVLISTLRIKKRSQADASQIIVFAILSIILAAGLVLAYSKGAIGATMIGLSLFGVLMLFGGKIARYKTATITVVALLTLAVVAGIIGYGLKNNTLPGGNSMLVRWQYWAGSAKIFAHNFLLGTGGGNFASSYLKYKIPAAIETVSDPHNFVLSILCQYGPFALIALLAAIFLPISNSVFKRSETASIDLQPRLAIFPTVLIAIALLALRPSFLGLEFGHDPLVKFYIITVMIVLPVAIFVIAGWVISKNWCSIPCVQTFKYAIVSGLVAVLIHNLIDFAIFEPANLMAFFALLAILAFLNRNETPDDQRKTYPNIRRITAGISICALVAFTAIALIPVVIVNGKISSVLKGEPDSISMLKSASKADPFDSTTLTMLGDLYRRQYMATKSPHDFETAELAYNRSMSRNYFDYATRLKEADLFKVMAMDFSDLSNRNINLTFTVGLIQDAIKLNPSKAELWFELGKTFETLNKIPEAKAAYSKAIEIESDFQNMFKKMYPDEDQVVYRMGKSEFFECKHRLNSL